MRDIYEVYSEIAEHLMDADRGREKQHQYGLGLQQDIYNALVNARQAGRADVPCDGCGKPMEDRGAAKQWCSQACVPVK